METKYYIGKSLTQAPHIIPIAEKLGGTVYTDTPEVYKWFKKYTNLKCKEINPAKITPCNLIMADYFKFPKTFNTIQIFHGFSYKPYINERPDWFTHVINPSPFYNLDTPLKGFSRYRKYDSNYIPGTCLYCPTHRLESTNYLRELKDKYPNIIVKFHPNDYKKNNPIVKEIEKIASVVSPTSEEYIRYEKLFNKAEVLASDYSSILYEFTLTGKQVITPNSKISHHINWFYNDDIIETIKGVLV